MKRVSLLNRSIRDARRLKACGRMRVSYWGNRAMFTPRLTALAERFIFQDRQLDFERAYDRD